MQLINQNNDKIHIYIFNSFNFFLSKSQCLIPNNSFKNVYTKNRLIYPQDWILKGKFVYVYDDRKPPMSQRTGGKPIFTWDRFKTKGDTSLNQILYMNYKMSMFGRKSDQSAIVKLTQPLEKDSIYLITMDISYGFSDCFRYKSYPIFLGASDKLQDKNSYIVKLKTSNDKELIGNDWNKVSATIKAKGTELYLGIKSNFEYKDFIKIVNFKDAKKYNSYGFIIYFDNICIEKVSK